MMLRKGLTVIVAAAATLLVTFPAGAGPARPAAAWSPAGSPVQTVFQTHAAFQSGKVYMPGGYLPGFTPYDKMQILATGSNTWSVDNQSMPAGPSSQSAVCAGGSKIYAIGGLDQNLGELSTLQIYNPSQPLGSRWSSGPSIHTGADGDVNIRSGGCAWIGGKLYLFGGTGISSKGTIAGTTDVTLVFDPGTQKWSNTGFKMVIRTWEFGYASNATSAFAAAGVDGNGGLTRTTEVFKPASGWSKMAKIPTPPGAPSGTGLFWPGMGLLGNDLAVFGGSDAQGVPVFQSRTLLCALPCAPTSSWTNGSRDLVVARDEMAFASGGSTPRLYAICGQNPAGPIGTAEKTA